MRSLIKKHPVVILTLLVLITAVIVYHKYVFGGYVFLFDDIGSDTKQQYIMHYNSIVNHLRNGDLSLWDSTNGFGTSMFQLSLFNPLLWIIYIVGLVFGNAAMAGCLVWVVILAMILSGIALWYYLSCFSFSEEIKLIAAYIYSFNGFIVVWGQHYAFLTISVYMPLLLALLEKALRRRRFSISVALISGLCVITSYYFAYMALLTAAVYVVIRLWTLRTGSVKFYFKALLKQAGAVLLGVGIGTVNLLPNISIVFDVSSRMQSGDSILQKIAYYMTAWPGEYYETLAGRFLSSTLQGNSSTQQYTGYANYYEAPNVFFTSLFVILLVQFVIYIIVSKWDKRLKAASVIGIALALFMLLVQAGSLAYNFFAYPFSRYTFSLMPFFALVTAFMLEKLFRERFLSLIGLVISAAGCLYVYYTAYKDAVVLSTALLAEVLAVLTIFLCVMLVLVKYVRKKNNAKKQLGLIYTLIFISIAGQVGINLYSTVYKREVVSYGSSYFDDLYGEDYAELSAYLEREDDSTYRIERDFTTATHTMDTLALDFSGASTYNSTMNANIAAFANEFFPEMYYEDVNHLSFLQVADNEQLHELFGFKYIVSKSSEAPYEDYELAAQFGSLYLYENKDWTGFASFYTTSVSRETYESVRDSVKDLGSAAFLSQVLIVEDDDDDNALDENQLLDLIEKIKDDSDIKHKQNADIQMKNTGKDGHYVANVSSSQDGYLMMPIPYETGWKVSVDGVEVTALKSDYGFSAVALSAGNHVVEYTYTQPYLYEGLIVTAFSVLACVVILAYRKKRYHAPL